MSQWSPDPVGFACQAEALGAGEIVLNNIERDGEMGGYDLDAGAGIVAAMDFRGRAWRVCGLDPDPRVVDNPYLDEGRLGVGEAIPYPKASFDLVFADNVLEHLPNPAAVFAEVARVPRPGWPVPG